ncbi:hypothetical protein [Sinorhizobium fredii]|uniref:hypothetical protein n=1 Tax=Rhizobium fredii TaxID=380 RepID=UPI00069385D3|nr:hypothetical protein [Sinorhizobium fredii]WOS66033.1 hypothetical protein SFGR64A_20100 [Sinorhizobium fredii GR64]
METAASAPSPATTLEIIAFRLDDQQCCINTTQKKALQTAADTTSDKVVFFSGHLGPGRTSQRRAATLRHGPRQSAARVVFRAPGPEMAHAAVEPLLVGLVGLLALKMDITTSTSFINFGASLAFTAVNISVIALYVKREPTVVRLGPLVGVVIPLLVAICDLYLLANLDIHAKTLGVVWLIAGTVYLAYLTRFFQSAPPELDFAE